MSEEFDPDNRGQVILYRANGVNVPVEVTYPSHSSVLPLLSLFIAMPCGNSYRT